MRRLLYAELRKSFSVHKNTITTESALHVARQRRVNIYVRAYVAELWSVASLLSLSRLFSCRMLVTSSASMSSSLFLRFPISASIE